MNKLAVSALVLGSAFTLQAAQEVHGPYTFGPDGNAPALPGDPNPTFDVPLFNPLGGTRELLAVRYDLRATLTDAIVAYENTGQTATSLKWTYDFKAEAFIPGIPTAFVGVGDDVTDTVPLGAFDGTIDFVGPSGGVAFIPDFLDTESGVLAFGSPGFNQFVGVGTIGVPYSVTGVGTKESGTSLVFVTDGLNFLELNVVYDWREKDQGIIPEASTMVSAAGLVGLCLLGWIVRRRAA